MLSKSLILWMAIWPVLLTTENLCWQDKLDGLTDILVNIALLFGLGQTYVGGAYVILALALSNIVLCFGAFQLLVNTTASTR